MTMPEVETILAPRMKKYLDVVEERIPLRRCGRVSQVVGVIVESIGPMMTIGDVCWISSKDGSRRILAEVVGLRGSRLLLMPYGPINGIYDPCAVGPLLNTSRFFGENIVARKGLRDLIDQHPINL